MKSLAESFCSAPGSGPNNQPESRVLSSNSRSSPSAQGLESRVRRAPRVARACQGPSQTKSAGARVGSCDRKTRLVPTVASWRSVARSNRRPVSGQPNFDQAHRFAATRTGRRMMNRLRCRSWSGPLGRWRGKLPGLLFLRGEQRCLFKKSAHAVGADFGRRMQSAKSAHPRVTRRQDMPSSP